MNKEEIFIQIASYRDPELGDTLNSLYLKAQFKQRLKFSICWQHSKMEEFPKLSIPIKQINIIDIDYKDSKGANWARSINQQFYNNEEYSLIIDSHLRFVQNWDIKLINLHKILKKKGIDKPLITGYPPPYDPTSYPQGRLNSPLKMYVEGYEKGLLIKFAGFPIPCWRWITEPIRAEFLALGFLFSEGLFNREIKIDPHIYFYGDEITTGLRSFCHGYDFFHPHILICWHNYSRDLRIGHWDNHKKWETDDRKSYRRVREILSGKNILNYPIGTLRRIEDYENLISFKLIQNGH